MLVFLFCFSLLLVAAAEPALVQAQDYGLYNTAREANLPMNDNTTDKLTSRVGTMVGIVLSFVGVLFLILIIYAGLTWMTAAGNEQKIGKAKDIIIAATIGLIIVLSAYAITKFIGTSVAN